MYIRGYADGLAAESKLAKSYNQFACLPSGITGGQMRLVVAKYMDDHPDQLNKSWSQVVADAILSVYSCKAPK